MIVGKKRLKNEYRGFEAKFLGPSERSDMVVVGNTDGCQPVALTKRLPPEGQADPAMIDNSAGISRSQKLD